MYNKFINQVIICVLFGLLCPSFLILNVASLSFTNPLLELALSRKVILVQRKAQATPTGMYDISNQVNQHTSFRKHQKFSGGFLIGKMNRGMTVLATWRHLLGDKTPTEDEHFSAVVLAWCVELVCTILLLQQRNIS